MVIPKTRKTETETEINLKHGNVLLPEILKYGINIPE